MKGGSAELTPSNWSLTPALSEGVRVAAGLHSTPALPNIRVWPFASNLNVRCSVAFGGESFAKPFWDPKRGTLFQIKPGLGNFDSKKLLLRVPLLPISVAEHPFAEFCNTVGGKARNPSQSGDPATDYSLRPHSVFNSIALSLAARHLCGRGSLAAQFVITREKDHGWQNETHAPRRNRRGEHRVTGAGANVIASISSKPYAVHIWLERKRRARPAALQLVCDPLHHLCPICRRFWWHGPLMRELDSRIQGGHLFALLLCWLDCVRRRRVARFDVSRYW